MAQRKNCAGHGNLRATRENGAHDTVDSSTRLSLLARQTDRTASFARLLGFLCKHRWNERKAHHEQDHEPARTAAKAEISAPETHRVYVHTLCLMSAAVWRKETKINSKLTTCAQGEQWFSQRGESSR